MSVPVLSGPDTPVVGTVVISRAQFRNNAGVLTDPDPVTFTVRSPSGVESTYQYTGGSDVTDHIVRNGVGDYQVAFEGTEPDWWDVEWQAEGALTIVGDGRALFRRQLDSSFIASPHCTIADIYYNADETPYAGAVIQAYWVNTPVLRAAGGVLANKHREIVADANGAWSADFIWASASYPTTTAVMLAFPRGERIAGIVPSITGPITLTELLAAPYNWAPVKPSQSVTVVQGPAGMKWRGDWDPFTAYHPNDVAQYGGSSWIALANSTDVIPGTDSTKWELVASVEGALASGDLTGTYLSPSLDLTKSHSWQGIQTGPFRDKGGARFNAKAYGAVGDGTTDDTAAVQAAWTAAAAVGGVTYLPAGTYAVDPATLGAPPTALHLLGDGYQSSLKVKDGAGDFRSLLIWSGAATGVTIRNLRFDGNASGYGGTIQNSTGAGDYESRTARILLFSGAATDVSVTDCWFTNTCGVHVMIANNASNARVRFDRNTVIWSMNAANISGGLDYDNSMVYIAGPAHITGNSFIQPTIPAPPYGARGALETIGGPVVVSNNLFQNFRTPLYALGSFAFPTSGSVGESVISGNTISGANQAIRLWPSTQGGKISITGNQIRLAQVTHNRLNCCGIWVEDDPTFISPIGEVTITGNTVTFEDESPAGRATDYQGSALTATDCIGIGAPSFNTVSGLSIIGNVIKGAPAYGIALGRSNTSRASTMRNVLARNNQIINAGQNIALGNTSRAGIFITANCENVKIAGNQISDVWGAFSTLPYSNAVAGTFLSSQQYWFAFDLTGAAGTSQGNNPIALTPQTNNTQIKLGIRLDNANITSVGIYADTTATPKRVGTIAVSYSGTAWTVGAITYDGTSSGLSAAVSGSGLTTSVLTVTLSDPQSGSSVGAAGTNGTGSGATAIPLTRQFYGIFAGRREPRTPTSISRTTGCTSQPLCMAAGFGSRRACRPRSSLNPSRRLGI
jgi:hypothetical protein